jgi:GDSL-like Lipase/Acylhydrolase family
MRGRWILAALWCVVGVACQVGGPGAADVAGGAATQVGVGAASPSATRAATKPHNFGQWERDVAAFEAADKAHPPAKGAVLFVGSSTIVRWRTLAEDFAGTTVLNRGFGGNEICDSTHFAERMIFPYEPRMIFLRAGGNDLWDGKSAEEVFGDFKEFEKKVHGRMPNVDIAFIGLAPTVARWKQAEKEKALNSMVEAYAKATAHVIYIESWDISLGPDGKPRPELFVSDGLHFSAAGYRVLVERVRPYVPKG